MDDCTQVWGALQPHSVLKVYHIVVCGRIRGYQFGATSAFFYADRGIDSYCVEGRSLTHGGAGNQQHIWTCAAGLSEITAQYHDEACPCDTAASDVVPLFVGNDHFCESGVHSEWSLPFILYPDGVLWDGQDCTTALHGLQRICPMQQLMILN